MMHDLLDNAAAAFVNRIRDRVPGRNLCRAMDAWHIRIAMPLNADRGCFGDN